MKNKKFLTKDEVDKLVEDHCEPEFIGVDIQKNGASFSDGFEAFSDKMKEAFPELKRPFSPEYVEGILRIRSKLLKDIQPEVENEVEKEIDKLFNKDTGDIKRLTPFQKSKIVLVSTPYHKEDSLFKRFMKNEINSEDYIKLNNDGKIEMSCSGGSIEELNSWLNSDMGKIPDVDYPSRHNFKKKENLLSKVVKWWRR